MKVGQKIEKPLSVYIDKYFFGGPFHTYNTGLAILIFDFIDDTNRYTVCYISALK